MRLDVYVNYKGTCEEAFRFYERLFDGKIVGEGDIRAQAEQCFRNIELLLTKAGATMADLVEVTCFLTDRDQLPTYMAMRAELFPVNPPATTTVVAQLALPSLMIEIKGIAMVRGQ